MPRVDGKIIRSIVYEQYLKFLVQVQKRFDFATGRFDAYASDLNYNINFKSLKCQAFIIKSYEKLL